MSSISQPYVYTDLPQPLDDIEIKEDADGFQIRLNQSGFVRRNTRSKSVNGGRNQPCNTNSNHTSQEEELCAQAVSHLDRCGDDVKIVETKRKRHRKPQESKNVQVMTKDPLQLRDNIFERMWLTDNAIGKNSTRLLDTSNVQVKEEKTDTDWQYGRGDATERFSEDASEITGPSSPDKSRISDPNQKKRLSNQSPIPSVAMDGHVVSSAPSDDRSCIVTEVEPICTIIISDDDTPDESEEPVAQKEYETSNTSENCNLTKYDLIKLRRAQSQSNTIDLTENVLSDRSNAKNKAKQSKTTVVKIFRNFDTDEEADDEESEASSGVDTDGTEAYDPGDFAGDGSSSDEGGGGNIKCPKCDDKFKDVSKLKAHMLSHFTEKSYQCKVCMRPFESNGGLKRHIVVHERNEDWTCKKCKKGFSSRRQLALHMSKLHPAFKRFKCDLCGERFDAKVRYNAHMMSHIEDNIAHANQSAVKEAAKQTGKTPTPVVPKKGNMKRTENKKSTLGEKSGVLEVAATSKKTKFPHSKIDITSSAITTENSPQQNHKASKISPGMKPSLNNSKAGIANSAVQNTKLVKTQQNGNHSSVTKCSEIKPNDNSSILSEPPQVNKPSVNEIGRKSNATANLGVTNAQPGTNKINDSNNNCHIGNSHDDVLPTIKSPVPRSRGKSQKHAIPKQPLVATVLKGNTVPSKQSVRIQSSVEDDGGKELPSAPVHVRPDDARQKSSGIDDKQKKADNTNGHKLPSKDPLSTFTVVKEKVPVTHYMQSRSTRNKGSTGVSIPQIEVTQKHISMAIDHSPSVSKSSLNFSIETANSQQTSSLIPGESILSNQITKNKPYSKQVHTDVLKPSQISGDVVTAKKSLNSIEGSGGKQTSTSSPKKTKVTGLGASPAQKRKEKEQATEQASERDKLSRVTSQPVKSTNSSGLQVSVCEKPSVFQPSFGTKFGEKTTKTNITNVEAQSIQKILTNGLNKNAAEKDPKRSSEVETRSTTKKETVVISVRTRKAVTNQGVETKLVHLKDHSPTDRATKDVEMQSIVTQSSQSTGDENKTAVTIDKAVSAKDTTIDYNKDERAVPKVNDCQPSVVSQNNNVPVSDQSSNSTSNPQKLVLDDTNIDRRSILTVPLKKRFRERTFENVIESASNSHIDHSVVKSASLPKTNTQMDSIDINAPTNTCLEEKESISGNVVKDVDTSVNCNTENKLSGKHARVATEGSEDKTADDQVNTIPNPEISAMTDKPTDDNKADKENSLDNKTSELCSEQAEKLEKLDQQLTPPADTEKPDDETEPDMFSEVHDGDLDVENNVVIEANPSSPLEDQSIKDAVEKIINDMSDPCDNNQADSKYVDDASKDQSTIDASYSEKTDDPGTKETHLSKPSNVSDTIKIDYKTSEDENNVTCEVPTGKSDEMVSDTKSVEATESVECENKSDVNELTKLEGQTNILSGNLEQSACLQTTKDATGMEMSPLQSKTCDKQVPVQSSENPESTIDEDATGLEMSPLQNNPSGKQVVVQSSENPEPTIDEDATELEMSPLQNNPSGKQVVVQSSENPEPTIDEDATGLEMSPLQNNPCGKQVVVQSSENPKSTINEDATGLEMSPLQNNPSGKQNVVQSSENSESTIDEDATELEMSPLQNNPCGKQVVVQSSENQESTIDEVLDVKRDQSEVQETHPCLDSKPTDTKQDANVSEVTLPQETTQKPDGVTEKGDETDTQNTEVDKTFLEEGTKISKKETNLPDLKVPQQMTGPDTKQNTIANAIKELLSNAANEDKAEIEIVLKELGLKHKTEKPKKKKSSKSKNDATKVESSIRKSQDSGNQRANYDSTHNVRTERDQQRSRSRSKSRDRNRHSRRSRSRDRYSKHHSDRRYSPQRYRNRSRSPSSRHRRQRTPDRGHRRSRTPEYKKYFQQYTTKYQHHGYHQLNNIHSRFTSHDKRHSEQSFGRDSHSYSRRRSVSPKRNSRSKDMQRFSDKARDVRSPRDYDNACRSPYSTERSTSSSHQTKDRQRSTNSRFRHSSKERGSSSSVEKDAEYKYKRRSTNSRERYGSIDRDSRRSSSERERKDKHSRRSTSSRERGSSKDSTRSSTTIDLTVENDVAKEAPKERSVSIIYKKKEPEKRWTSKSWTSLSDNSATGITDKETATITNKGSSTESQNKISDQEEPRLETDCTAKEPLKSVKNGQTDLTSGLTGKITVPKALTDMDRNCKTNSIRKAELYDPWNLDDDNNDSKTPEKDATTGTNDNTQKQPVSTEDKWRNAWYQKVDNKKLILDTMENDSHGKHVDQLEKTVSVSRDKEQEKKNAPSCHTKQFTSQESSENDDVFLPVLPPPDKLTDRRSGSTPLFKSMQNNDKATGNISTVTTGKDLNSKEDVPQTTSLFKNTTSVSKTIFPDFKVTIQNTAKFISVMESPASPDPETSNSEESPRFVFGSHRYGLNNSKPLSTANVKPKHVSKPLETKIDYNKSEATMKHIQPVENSDTKNLTSQRNGSIGNPLNSGAAIGKLRKEQKCQPNKANKDPNKSSNSMKTPSSDPVETFNQTLQQLHSTLQKLTKSVANPNPNDNSTGKSPLKIQTSRVKDKTNSSTGIQQKAASPVKLNDPRKVRSMSRTDSKNILEQKVTDNLTVGLLKEKKNVSDKTVKAFNEKLPNAALFLRTAENDHVKPVETAPKSKRVEQKSEKPDSKSSKETLSTETNIRDQVLSSLKEYLQPDEIDRNQVEISKSTSLNPAKGNLEKPNSTPVETLSPTKRNLGKPNSTPVEQLSPTKTNLEKPNNTPVEPLSPMKRNLEKPNNTPVEPLSPTKRNLEKPNSTPVEPLGPTKTNLEKNNNTPVEPLSPTKRNLEKPNSTPVEPLSPTKRNLEKPNSTPVEQLSPTKTNLEKPNNTPVEPLSPMKRNLEKPNNTPLEPLSPTKGKVSQSIDETLSKLRSECSSIVTRDSKNEKKTTADNESKSMPSNDSTKYEREYERESSESSQAKRRRISESSGNGTPVHDERESKGQHHDGNKQTVKSPSKGVTGVQETGTAEKMNKITQGESFYLASQQSRRSEKNYYDEDTGAWIRSPTDSKRYWTKYPSHDRNTTGREHIRDRDVSPRKSSILDRDRQHKCHECNLTFDDFFQFDVHRVVTHGHGDKKVYMCQICHQRFRYHAELDKHKLTEHKSTSPFKCLDCSDTFSTAERLNFHKYFSHGGPKAKEYSRLPNDHSRSSVKRYQDDHYSDPVPSKRYRHSEELPYSRHEKGEETKVVRCPRCPQIFTTPRNLKNHMYARHYRKPGVFRQPFSWKQSKVYSDYYRATHSYRRRRKESESSNDDDRWSPGPQMRNFTITVKSADDGSQTRLLSPKRQRIEEHNQEVSPSKHPDIPVIGRPLPTSPQAGHKTKKDESTETDSGEQRLFKCALCGESCATEKEFNIHLTTHSNPEPTEQPTLNNSAEFKKGESSESADDVMKRQCPVCYKILSSPYSKERHMFLHSGEKPFSCTVEGCDRRFIQKSDMMSHILIHKRHPGGSLKRCPHCSITFKYESNYQKHLSSHQQTDDIAGVFSCDLCDTKYTSAKALKKHTKKTHPADEKTEGDILSNDSESEAILRKRCKYCGVKFMDEDLYWKHVMTHEGVNPYRCTVPQCNRAFGDNFALKRHTRTVHPNKKDIKCLKRVCNECGAMFLTHKAFENHKLVHKGENPYRCSIEDCDKLLSDAIALKRHQVHAHKYSTTSDATRGFRLHCEECGSIFYNSTLLEQHMITHGKHTYTCPDAKCSRKFQKIDDLQGHLQSTKGHDSEVIWKECKHCNEKCLTLHQLEKHRANLHQKSRVFKCDQPGCTAAYTYIFDLKRHSRNEHKPKLELRESVSEDDKKDKSDKSTSQANTNLSCTICKKSFLTTKSMRIHYSKMHGRKRALTCEICRMTFTRRETHHIHMMKHKKVNPFKCQICKKTFWQRKERDKHKHEEHASEMSLGCPKCDRKFFDIKSLRIHLFKTHEIKITATIVDNKREEHTKETDQELLGNDGAEESEMDGI